MNQTQTELTPFEHMGYLPTYKQYKFIKAAKKAGHKVYYNYSGRGMFGRKCPAYNCDNHSQIIGGYSVDNMGLGYVVYCP